MRVPQYSDNFLSLIIYMSGRYNAKIFQKMRRISALIVLILIIVISCKQTDTERKLIRKSSWFEYYQIEVKSFNDTLNIDKSRRYVIDYNPKAEYLENYNEFFIYSPNNNFYIDLDSYSLILEKDSMDNLISYGGEVDTEVGLVNINANERLRILFCGTACWPEEAEWIDNENIQIYGFSDLDNLPVPTIWAYNLTDTALLEIRSNSVVKKTPGSYIESVRLDKVNFDVH